MARLWRTPLRFFQQTRPAVPPVETVDLYAREGRLFAQDSSGVERIVDSESSVAVSQTQPVLPLNGIWVELNADNTVKTFWISTP